jgi:hypothetical protein
MMKIFPSLSVGGFVLALLVGAAFAAPPSARKPPATPQAGGGETYDLKYKFRAGEVVRTEVVHRATVETSIQGTSQTTETRSSSVKAWKITGISPSGLITFVHSVENIDMWQKMQGRQEVRYNSQTDKNVPAGYEDAAKAVGVPLTEVTMDRRGKIVRREEKHAHQTTSPAPMTTPLPERPVAVGHVWSTPLEVEVLLQNGGTRKIQTRQQFTLAKVADGIATIQVETQVLTPINDPAIEAQLIQRLSDGTIQFDIAAGRVVAQQMDLDRRVIGFSGASSSMHYLTRFTEKLLPESPQTAEQRRQAAGGRRK